MTAHAHLITHTESGRQFVGWSRRFTPLSAWAHHVFLATYSDAPLHVAMRLHGLDAFTFEVLTYDAIGEVRRRVNQEIVGRRTYAPHGYNGLTAMARAAIRQKELTDGPQAEERTPGVARGG